MSNLQIHLVTKLRTMKQHRICLNNRIDFWLFKGLEMFYYQHFVCNYIYFLKSSVQKGILLSKEDKSQNAMLCYNKALSIDEENVEAFVARGAL